MPETRDVSDERERDRRQALMERLQMLGEMSSTETAMFHQVAAAKVGLGITDMKALSALLREGAMTAGQLAQRLSLTTGAVTNVIDRLQRQRMVKREPDPDDRRKVIVTVDTVTIGASDNVYRSMGEAFYRLFDSYTTDQLAFLAEFYQASIEVTQREIAKLAKADS